MDDMFETDFSFLAGVQVEVVPETIPWNKIPYRITKNQRKIHQVAGLSYEVCHSEETRAKMSKAASARMTVEARKHLSDVLSGRPQSVEQRKKSQDCSSKAKPVMTPYGEFCSAREAGKILNVNVGHMIRTGRRDYYFITKEAK